MVNSAEIIRLRRERQWTQSDLSNASGISLRQICRIENGQGDTTTGVLIALAKALGVKPVTLLDDGNPTQPLPNIQPEQGLGRTAV